MGPEQLLKALRTATADLLAGMDRVAVAYSGGVDSSLVAALFAELVEVRCYACFTEGSRDATGAQAMANEEGRRIVPLLIREDELSSVVKRAGRALGSSNPVQIAYSIPLLQVIWQCDETTVMAGNGADELFGGYAKYIALEDPSRAMASDLKRALRETELYRAEAQSIGKSIGFPFLHEGVTAFAASIPLSDKIRASDRKLILREAARALGLPSHDQPKKAAQYSSGIMKAMERAAKNSRTDIGEWTRLATSSRSGTDGGKST